MYTGLKRKYDEDSQYLSYYQVNTPKKLISNGDKKIDNSLLLEEGYDAQDWLRTKQFHYCYGSLKFIKFLGRGKFGSVRLAQYKDKEVVCKNIEEDTLDKVLTRAVAQDFYGMRSLVSQALAWEMKCLFEVQHPNIVACYGAYYDKLIPTLDEGRRFSSLETPYLVLEYCEKGNLREQLDLDELPWSKRWQWALEITDALNAIHDCGLLHQDLKSENILIDKNGRVKIADFGIAQKDRLLGEQKSSIAARCFNVMAPEELSSKVVTKKNDIYALGTIFWELLTGQKPRQFYTADKFWSEDGAREEIPEKEATHPFAALIRRCWVLNPKERPTIKELQQELIQLGPHFHPKAQWVALAEKLERQIHSSEHDLNYQDIQVSTSLKKETQVAISSASLALDQFFDNPELRILILTGEKGAGKTAALKKWARKLLDHCWNWINVTEGEIPCWPLFIKPSAAKLLEAHFEFPDLATLINQGIIIVDACEKLSSEELKQLHNLSQSLGKQHKFVLSWQQSFSNEDESLKGFIQKIEQPLSIIRLLPLQSAQILDYLKQRRGWSLPQYNIYKPIIENLPELQEALNNPYALDLLCQVWRSDNRLVLKQCTPSYLYESFIKHQIGELFSVELAEKFRGRHADLFSSFMAYFIEIKATSLVARNDGEREMDEENIRIPSLWFQLKTIFEQDCRAQFKRHREELKSKQVQNPLTLLSEEEYLVLRWHKLENQFTELVDFTQHAEHKLKSQALKDSPLMNKIRFFDGSSSSNTLEEPLKISGYFG